MTLRGYGIIVAAFFTVSIAYAVRYGYGMLLPGMISALEITKTQAGLISSAYFVAYTICSPVLGLLSDFCNPRLLLTLFPALLALGALLMAYASTVLQAAVIFALAGVGHSACWAPVVSLVQQWVDDRQRGLALSIATTGSGIGIAAWSLWLPVVAAHSGYRQGWVQMGCFGFLVVILNFLLIRRAPDARSASALPSQNRFSFRDTSFFLIFGDFRLWLIGMSYAGVGFTVLVPFTFLNVYATEQLHLSYEEATRFFTVLAVSGIAGKLLLGIVSDRVGRIRTMMLSCLLLGAGCWGVVHLQGLTGKYVSTALTGTGFGAVWPLYAAVAVDFFPRELSGRVIGIWTFFLGIGSILSPLLCGWTIDITGSQVVAFRLGWIVALFSVFFLIPLLNHAGQWPS